MNLDLSSEEEMLEASFADLFAKESSPERVRAAEPCGFDLELWNTLHALGATSLAVSAAQGGGGGRCFDLMLVARQAGRRLAPVPFVEAAVATNLIARSGDNRLLREILDGRIPTLALRPVSNERLSLVPAGAVADIVITLDSDELVAFVASPGVDREIRANLGSSPLADVDLAESGLRRVSLATGKTARSLFDSAIDEWKLLTAALLDGLRAEALAIGVAYAKARRAFGVPIGAFQAIQHRLADVAVAGDASYYLVCEAAWARDTGQGGASELAAMAFLHASEIAFLTSRESLQFHGGYGYTVEYDIQLYFRRAKAWPLALGDPSVAYRSLGNTLLAATS